MFVDTKKKFIYIRPKKVGSSAIINALWSNRLNKSITINGFRYSQDCFGTVFTNFENGHFMHPLPADIEKIMGDDFYNYHKFTTIRNPYDHALSNYLFLQRRFFQIYSSPRVFLYHLNTMKKELFKTLFFSIRSKASFNYYLKNFYKPYTEYSYLDNKNIIDSYLCVENLEEDFLNLSKNFNLDNEGLKFKNVNKIDNKEIYQHYFTKKNIDLIKQKYKFFIEKFNYSEPNV